MLHFSISAQSIIYFNSNDDTVSVEDEWEYFIQKIYDTSDVNVWKLEKINKDGHMLFQKFEKVNKDGKEMNHGKYLNWFNDGQLFADIDYQEGKLDGKLLLFWKNGQLRREQNYKNEMLIDGNCYDS